MRLTFDTWQFVRIMVRLEETVDQDAAHQKLWAQWSDDWHKVDNELERLRGESLDLFSKAMMDEQISFDDVDRMTKSTVVTLANEVIDDMKKAVPNASGEMKDDLTFEIAALTSWVRNQKN